MELPGVSSIRNTAGWWFLPLLFLPQLIPPYASHGYAIAEWPAVNQYIITHPVKTFLPTLYPFFKIIPLIILTGVFLNKKVAGKLFIGWVALVYVLAAFLQSVSVSSRFGIAICTGNLVIFVFLAVIWAREALRSAEKFSIPRLSLQNFWLLVAAFLAFWYPVNLQTLLPDFNPVYLVTSGAGLSFCLSTPLFLSVFLVKYPFINPPVIACTAFVGFFMGVSNLVLEWVIIPSYWWIGVLHLPLVIISAFSLFRVLPLSGIRAESLTNDLL
jgi:hypothetical protein